MKLNNYGILGLQVSIEDELDLHLFFINCILTFAETILVNLKT